MTTVSLNFRNHAFAQNTGVVAIGLITISHESLTDDIRISTDPTVRLSEPADDIIYGTVSRGENYFFFPVTLKLPDDTDDGPGLMSIEIDNVSREYVEVVRSITGRPRVKAEFVLSNALDTVEATWPEFLMTDISYDAFRIRANMYMEMLHDEPYPAMTFTPSRAPGLF